MRDIEPDAVDEAVEIATTRTVVAELEYVVTPPESGEAVDRAAKVERRAEDLALLADEAAEVTERDGGGPFGLSLRRAKPPIGRGSADPAHELAMTVEIRDVADGLWLWRQPHWEWRAGDDWEPEVSSFVVEAGRDVILLDPLAPPPSARHVYDRLEANRPTVAVVLKPDHVRDVELFVHWYGTDAYGPWLFWKGDAPRSELKPLREGDSLPGGLVPLNDGRGMMETPIYLPHQRTIVFADGMTAPGGVLRVWRTATLEKRVLPVLREMLDLPFERVLVSHGEPIHDRDAFEAALEREPWPLAT